MSQTAAARPSVRSRFEFIVSDGVLLPTDDQRDALKNARINLAQLSRNDVSLMGGFRTATR